MNPTLFRQANYRFFFFSREEERMHVHVHAPDGEAKFWLEPERALAKNYRLSKQQLKEVENIIKEHHHEFIGSWKQYFNR